MMPDMAAMMTAITVVTTATPPRIRPSAMLSESYMSLARPLRSNGDAMKMNSGTAMMANVIDRS